MQTSIQDPSNTALPLTVSRDWHTQSIEDLAFQLGVDPQQGLSVSEALARLERDGANRLIPKPRRPAWRLFIDQFKNLLIVILLGAVVLAWTIGDLIDALVILGVVIFNALLGFHQEFRAEQAVAALKRMLAQHATVRRGGVVVEVSRFDLVPGDVVLLDAGGKVPADATIVRTVREGRTIYDNIGKFVRFQLSTNIGALLTVGTAPLLGMPIPFTAIQILWVNIIMDGPPAMALGVDPARPGVMNKPPRGLRGRLLDGRLLIRLAGYGTIMTLDR
jgi:magnesium-transporting ATPase (P-type)